jgi:hypothetical protein
VNVDMARIGLRSINVALDYGNPADPPNHRHTDLVFDATTPMSQRWEVFVNNTLDLGFTPRIEYNFDPQSDWQGEQFSYVVEPGWTTDRSLTLNPYEQLGFLEVGVLPTTLDATTFSSVDVTLRYTSPTGWTAERVLPVTATSAPQTWRVRTPEPLGSTYTRQLTYHLVSGGTFVTEETDSKAGSVVVSDPFTGHAQPEFRFAFAPGRFDEVVIDLGYEDATYGYRHSQRLRCDGSQTGLVAQPFGILTASTAAPEWTFRAHLLGPGGAVVNGPEVRTDQVFLSLTDTGEVAG